jgi:hypothetical protein
MNIGEVFGPIFLDKILMVNVGKYLCNQCMQKYGGLS